MCILLSYELTDSDQNISWIKNKNFDTTIDRRKVKDFINISTKSRNYCFKSNVQWATENNVKLIVRNV